MEGQIFISFPSSYPLLFVSSLQNFLLLGELSPALENIAFNSLKLKSPTLPSPLNFRKRPVAFSTGSWLEYSPGLGLGLGLGAAGL